MNWNTNLTGTALEIAKADEKRLRVVAGPGTGKSFALRRRIARLLEQGQDPDRILVVTFTRNAAASLIQDLIELKVVGCKRIHVSTLHAHCLSLLRKAEVSERHDRVYDRSIVTFSTSGALQFEGSVMLNDLAKMKIFGDKRKCTDRVKKFEAGWATLQSEQPGWPTDPIDKQFNQCLISWLRFHRAMLIGELIPETLHFLQDNPSFDSVEAFDHVLVDEYQDLNRAEQEIIDLLSNNASLAIVGDRDQSIYGFRCANPDGIDNFKKRHPETHDMSLTLCRRCPSRVVEIANQLIGNNYSPKTPPRLQAMPNNKKGEVNIVQWTGLIKEARGVAEYISHLVNERGYDYRDILILTPRKQLAYKILDVIKKKNIPIYSFYNEKALENKLAQRSFTLLALLDNIEDRVALRWWLNPDNASDLNVAYQNLREYCEETGNSPIATLKAVNEDGLQIPDVLPLLTPFRELTKRIARLSSLCLRDLIDIILPEGSDACSALRDIAEQTLESSTDIHQLFRQIKDNIVHPEVPEGNFVRIMSPHKSKGLSSKVVIVTSCIEKLFPYVNEKLSSKKQKDAIREQRRLFYVAVTRCREVLVLSSFIFTDRRTAFRMEIPIRDGMNVVRASTSRFIHELGPTAPRARKGIEWQESGYGEEAEP